MVLGIWGQNAKVEQRGSNAYFRYFTGECEAWRLSGCLIAIRTYRDLLELIERMENYRRDKRASSPIYEFLPAPLLANCNHDLSH